MSKLLRVHSNINHEDFSSIEPHEILDGSHQQRLNNVLPMQVIIFFAVCGNLLKAHGPLIIQKMSFAI